MQRPRRLVEAVKLVLEQEVTVVNSQLHTQLVLLSRATQELRVRCQLVDRISTKCSRSEREQVKNTAMEHLPWAHRAV